MPSSASLSDEELARRAQLGCMASFEELVRRLQTPLVHFLRQMARADEADDLAQDTFFRAYRNLDRYNGSSRFSTWLFTIGRRLCLNANRRPQPGGDTQLPDSIESHEPAPPQIAAERERRTRLWEVAARRLTEPEYSAVWLHYVEGMATAEIGRVVGRSRMAVKGMLFRSRKKLIHALGELVSDTPTRKNATVNCVAAAAPKPTRPAATGDRAGSTCRVATGGSRPVS